MTSRCENAIRLPRKRHSAAAAIFALTWISGFGCSARTVVVHDEPRLVSEEVRLVIETEIVDAGCIRLRAFRQNDRVFKQDYWREKGAARDVLPADGWTCRTASVGVNWGGFSGDHFLLALAIAGLAVLVVVAWPALLVYAIAGGSINVAGIFGAVADDQRTTIRRVESTRTACTTASVESAVTGQSVNLGPQPHHGWIILPETVRLLGGPGAQVTVRDGELSTTIVLGAP